MPIHHALRSPAVQNLAAAATAGLMTLARPARFPRWARNTLRWGNAAGTVGVMYLAHRAEDQSAPDSTAHSALTGATSIASAAVSGVGLVTSGLGIAADRKVEQALVRRGVRHPRLWIAVGVVGVVFALRTVQEVVAKRAEHAARRLAPPQHGGARPLPGVHAAASTPPAGPAGAATTAQAPPAQDPAGTSPTAGAAHEPQGTRGSDPE